MDSVVSTEATAFKRRLSYALRRVPWLVRIMRLVFRRMQAHFTVGVVGVVLDGEGRVLLVEHVFHPGYPWGLPGGWLEGGESPADALERELREETGLAISIQGPLLVDIAHHSHHLDVAFLCRARGDVQKLSSELLDYRWASFGTLPPLSPFHQAAVAAAQARRNNEGIEP